MIIAITGHTQGIGKATFDLLELKGHKVYGFSRSNSFDVSDPCTWNEILKTDADVIVKPKAFTEGPLEDEGDWFYPTDNGNGRVTVKIDPIHVGG